jgi:Mce-associated membrane protein
MEGERGQRCPILTPVRIRRMSSRRSETVPDSKPDAGAPNRPRTKRGTEAEREPVNGEVAPATYGTGDADAEEVSAESTDARSVAAEPARTQPSDSTTTDTSAEASRRAAALAALAEARPATSVDRGEAEAQPADDEEPVDNEESADDPEQARRVRRLVVLGVAAVLLVAASVVLGVGALTARDSGPLANEAYVDSAATAEVVGQVTDAITTVYSYDYNSLPANEAAAKGVITGKFADEFARVFEPVKQLAPAQQAVLRTSVPAAGVSLLQGDRARLLMMVDQSGTREQSREPTGATARLVVDAQKVDGRWKISEVTPE